MELPDPLFPFDVYKPLIDAFLATDDTDELIDSYKEVYIYIYIYAHILLLLYISLYNIFKNGSSSCSYIFTNL